MRFERLVGQSAAVGQILAAVARNRIPHAWLFHGRRGVGKTTAALSLARLLQCHNRPGAAPAPAGAGDLFAGLDAGAGPGPAASPQAPLEPCETCRSCHKSGHFNHPDIFLIPPTPTTPDTEAGDAQRTTFISDCQEGFRKDPIYILDESRPLEHRIRTMRWLKQEAGKTCVDGPYKIFILKAAGYMNAEAANAILKVLEEPNPGTILILCMERPAELPDTIKSRCSLVRFRDLSTGEVSGLLAARLAEPDPGAVRLAARLARGSVTRAAALLEADVLGVRDEAVTFLMRRPGEPGLHDDLDVWLKEKDRSRMDLIFDLVLLWYGDLLRLSVGAADDRDGLANADRLEELQAMVGQLTSSDISEAIRKVEAARAAADGYGYLPLVLYSLSEQVHRGPSASRRNAASPTL